MSPEAEAIQKADLATWAERFKREDRRPEWMRNTVYCSACSSWVYPKEHKEGGQSCRMREANRYGAKR